MTIIDYIKNHAEEDFTTFKFTEVDNLILSLIPYLDLTNYVPAFRKNKITLAALASSLSENSKIFSNLFTKNTFKMLKIMASTKRYGEIYLYNYMHVVNKEMQFGAITMLLSDHSLFIAFAGTDSSLIGWEEDFKMAYLYPGVSQKYASIYLNKALGILPKTVRIGGHSKGGNLAIAASMNTKFYNHPKIVAIYNNDGPGFLKAQVTSKKYQKISSKIKMYVPKESIIGMILYHNPHYEVVKAKSISIFQHSAFNWLCTKTGFKHANQAKRSKALTQKINAKLENLPLTTRTKLVKDIFDIFKNNNIKDTKDINLTNIFKLFKDFKDLDKETLNLLLELLIILFIK